MGPHMLISGMTSEEAIAKFTTVLEEANLVALQSLSPAQLVALSASNLCVVPKWLVSMMVRALSQPDAPNA